MVNVAVVEVHAAVLINCVLQNILRPESCGSHVQSLESEASWFYNGVRAILLLGTHEAFLQSC